MYPTPNSWLCPTAADRRRFDEMQRRTAPLDRGAMVALALLAAAIIPWAGVGPLVLVGLRGASRTALQQTAARLGRPAEYAALTDLLISQLLIGILISQTGGPTSPYLPLALLPVVALAPRFAVRGVLIGGTAGILVLLAATAGAAPAATAADPRALLSTLATLLVVAGAGLAMGASDRSYRHAAAADVLTGLPNRGALEHSFAELGAHAPISLALLDIDHFKAVNDTYGHERGDQVLSAVARILSSQRQANVEVARLGGEEFALVIAGDHREALTVAETVRQLVERAQPGEIPTTLSFGLAANLPPQTPFAEAYRRADEALYEAKRRGRNQGVTASRLLKHAPALTRLAS